MLKLSAEARVRVRVSGLWFSGTLCGRIRI